jgi:hypothetical protein
MLLAIWPDKGGDFQVTLQTFAQQCVTTTKQNTKNIEEYPILCFPHIKPQKHQNFINVVMQQLNLKIKCYVYLQYLIKNENSIKASRSEN